MIQCNILTKLKSYENTMLTIPVNCDHMITKNVTKDLLTLKCTCHLKTLSYCLQMINICKLYKIYMSTGHTIQKAIESVAIW